jgi:pimeloyl-ACP methyl ester carboxylesterase
MPDLLAHRVDGSGEPVLLLNGGMMTLAAWEEIAAPLAARFRVVRCDFRGQLLSPGPAPADLDGHVADVVALLDALGIDRAHVVATSFGAEVGLVLAAEQPHRVSSLVAATAFDHASPEMTALAQAVREACCAAVSGGDGGRMFDAMLPATYSDAFRTANAAMLATRRERVAQLPASWFAGVDGILAAVQHLDLRPVLPRIGCPTLVVVAGLDRTAPPQRGRALATAIPGARLVEAPDSGHAMVVEQPRRFTEICLEFLAALPAASPSTPSPDPGGRTPDHGTGPGTDPRPADRARKGAQS